MRVTTKRNFFGGNARRVWTNKKFNLANGFSVRLFAGGVRGDGGNVRVERVPAAAAVVVRDVRGRRIDVGRRGRGRRGRRVGRGGGRVPRTGQRGRGGQHGGGVHADGQRVPGVPGVRGARVVRPGQGGPAPEPPHVRQLPGAPVQLGRRLRASDRPRRAGPRLAHVSVGARARAQRHRRGTGGLRVRLRAAAQRRRGPARLSRRDSGVRRTRRSVRHRQGT